ncbi:MAG: multiprotein-bridging factor 1 family protein [Bacteriovoracaceae bacterium]
MTKKEFGKWLTKKRESLNVTQEQLGRAIGYSGKELAKVEAGITEFPKSKMQALQVHLKVEKKFDLHVKMLFHGDKKKSA